MKDLLGVLQVDLASISFCQNEEMDWQCSPDPYPSDSPSPDPFSDFIDRSDLKKHERTKQLQEALKVSENVSYNSSYNPPYFFSLSS